MGYYENRLLTELDGKGYKYQAVSDIFRLECVDPIVVETILKWLPELYAEHYGTADILVRALISAKEPFDPTLLIDLFENSDLNFYLKTAIGLALAYGKTPDISGWLKNQLLTMEYSVERGVLVEGLFAKGGFKTEREYMDFLKLIFDKYHNDTVLKIFKKIGNAEDIQFLVDKSRLADAKLAKKIKKALGKKWSEKNVK